ncbi:PAS domain-containing protein [Sphingobium sp. AN641]|uniref:PAS domain-containing protein n=1 Tax=Sphingobium sp. AN641 TaxID=3133443 RepID=UPI0030BE84D3
MNHMLKIADGEQVAAAELVRNFAYWREVGQREPVTVTHHGRGTHMFISVDHYRALAKAALTAQADTPTRMRELAALLHQGVILCGPDLGILMINPAALAITKRWDRHLEGLTLWRALPEFAGTLTEAHIRHSLASGEVSAADIPSPFRKESWLHFESYPFADGVALLFRDITLDMQQHRLADAKAAMTRAVALHDGIGSIRLSPRGFIESVDEAFCTMMALPEARLCDVAVADLIDVQARPPFRTALEQVLSGAGDCLLATRLLTNRSATIAVDAALVRLEGTYGTEGAVMIVTCGPEPRR